MRFLLVVLLFPACSSVWAEPAVDLVRVMKSEHRLQLISRGAVLQEFHVALGGNPVGHKQQEGDERTPEGHYTLDYRNPGSGYHKSIHISYPNKNDIASAKSRDVKPGGQVMIHGQKNGWGWLSFISQRINWTNGCIALSNDDMDTLWSLVRDGTNIEILP